MEPAEIVRRVDSLKTARSNVETIWNDVEHYIMPLRIGNMYQRPVSETSINLDRDDVYDSTAIYAAQKMSNAMHGSITYSWVKWYGRQFRLRELNKDTDSVTWLQDSTEREWVELYDANFDPEISSAYQDLVGCGNCFYSVEPENDSPLDWRGFNFLCIPIKEAFFERDHRGDMYRFFWWRSWTATEIKSKWPKQTLPAIVEKAFGEGGNPDERFEVVFAVYVRPDKAGNTGQVYSERERPVGCKYVLKASKEMLGEEGGYYDFPVFHCPWEKTSGSAWGHGPGMLMSPTAKYINYRLEEEDTAIRKALDPPTLAEERGLISDLDVQPGGITYVRRLDAVKSWHTEGRIDFSKMSLDELRGMVREAFHNDELQLKDSPTMSATEAQIRYELMNRVLGPTMGRIQNQLLSKILDRTFKTLMRNGQFEKPPPAVLQKKAQLKVVYTGALMRAQQSDEVAAIERWMGQIGAVAKVFPTVANVVDVIEWARELALKLGIPARMVRSVAQVQELVKTQQAAAAEQAKNAILQQRADVENTKADTAQKAA